MDEAGVREKLAKGVAAVVEEWQGALRAGDATSSDIENVEYVLAGEAGSSSKRFQHGWIRDRAPDHESSALPERTIHGRGMRLADFENQPQVRTAKLSTAHVFALRLYTTSCYDSINKPLREVKTDKDGEIITPLRLKAPYPLPCTLHLVADGLKRLRATLRTKRTQNPLRPMAENFDSVDAEIPAMETFELEMLSNDANLRSSLLQPTKWRDHLGQRLRSLLGGGSGLPAPLESSQKVWDGGKRRASVTPTASPTAAPPQARYYDSRPHKGASTILWRGMRDVRPSSTATFMHRGGSELAPCSTTADLCVAVRYSRGHSGNALIFRVQVGSFMQHGGDLRFLSAFPHEREVLVRRQVSIPRSTTF